MTRSPLRSFVTGLDRLAGRVPARKRRTVVCCLCKTRQPASQVITHPMGPVCRECWDERLRTTQ
jgi:hypothetical protein